MKTIIISLLLLSTVTTALYAQNNFSVEIMSVEQDKGYVFLGLYNNKRGFLDNKSQISSAKIKATGDKLVYTFKNLPDGEYAVAAYQDVNNNGKCDRNLFGYPTEGFGFSKNYKPKLSAPSFDEVKIPLYMSAKTSIVLIDK